MSRLITLAAIAALAVPCIGCSQAKKPAKKKPAAEKKADGDAKDGEKKKATVPGADPTKPVTPTKPAGGGF